MKVKCDHRSKFSNLSNWKEEEEVTGSNPVEALIFFSVGKQQALNLRS